MPKYILAIDQGTTSSRALVFDQKGAMVQMEQQEFKQHFPKDGWVEHDPVEIIETQKNVLLKAVENAGITWDQVAALGVTNQRETAVGWNKITGEPCGNALVWQDQRTKQYCKELSIHQEMVGAKTGLVIDTYFSASKFRWLLDNSEKAKEWAEKDELCLGTVDAWLLWNLSDGKVFATDVTNASRTLLFNIHTLDWDDELLDLFGISRSMLPEVHASDYCFAHFMGAPIHAVMGDQQSALYGQLCWEKGQSKNTYGTGCFMLMNTGKEAHKSEHGLLTTIAWKSQNEVYYALEGSVFIAGAAIQWLRDGLELIDNANETEELAKSATSDDVYVIPAFAGLGAPWWDMEAKGAVLGLTRNSDKAELVKATLESLAFQTNDVLEAMNSDCGEELTVLKVDGGACANNYLMQFQADILNVNVERPKQIESTACGVAYMAGIACDLWSPAEVQTFKGNDRYFIPSMQEERRRKKLEGWKMAVNCIRKWKPV
ncbi:MAG: glycerol kinase [Litorivivens sp.]|jgi:glycerol kinase